MSRLVDLGLRATGCSGGLHGDCRGERRGSCDCWCHGARRPSNNPAGRPRVLAGGRRVQLYVDGETDRIVAARAARDGVSWAEALRRIVRGIV